MDTTSLTLDLESYKSDNERLRQELKEAKLAFEQTQSGKSDVLMATELAIQIDLTKEQMKEMKRSMTEEYRLKYQTYAFEKRTLRHENRRLKHELRTKVWQAQWDAAITDSDTNAYEKALAEKRVHRELVKREKDLQVVDNVLLRRVVQELGRRLEGKTRELEKTKKKQTETADKEVSRLEKELAKMKQTAAKLEKDLARAQQELERSSQREESGKLHDKEVKDLARGHEKEMKDLIKNHEREMKELSKTHDKEIRELTKSVDRLTSLVKKNETQASVRKSENQDSSILKKANTVKQQKRVEIVSAEPSSDNEPSSEYDEPVKQNSPPPKKRGRPVKETVNDENAPPKASSVAPTKKPKSAKTALMPIQTNQSSEEVPIGSKKKEMHSSSAEETSSSTGGTKKKKRLLGNKSKSSLFSFGAGTIENTDINTYNMPTALSPIKGGDFSSGGSSLFSERSTSNASNVFGGGRRR